MKAAFVVTFSAVSLLAGCKKNNDGGLSNGRCEPPDCHMNPPGFEPTAVPDAGAAVPSATTSASSVPIATGATGAPTVTINANPPAIPPDAGKSSPPKHGNPPPPHSGPPVHFNPPPSTAP